MQIDAYHIGKKYLLSFLFLIAFQFGADRQEGLSVRMRNTQMAIYTSNMTLYMQRVQRAMGQVKMYSKDASMDDIAIIGYCFGGAGVVQYGFSGAKDTKVAVAFHGGISLTKPPTRMDPISPYMLM
jgi:dienelactone hydrolase